MISAVFALSLEGLRYCVRQIEWLRTFMTLLWDVIWRSLKEVRGVAWRQVVAESYEIANASSLFVALITIFCGAIMIMQGATQAQRFIGDMSPIGPAFLQLLVREFGPIIVALMIATRYGAGVAAQIGTMVVTEQLDALRMSGVDPIVYLAAPRIWGGLFAMLPVIIFGTAVAYCTGGLLGAYVFGIGYDTYFSMRMLAMDDVIVGSLKSVVFGAVVPAAACVAGLQARGGAAGVGIATTRAVIGGSVGVLILDFVISAVGYIWH